MRTTVNVDWHAIHIYGMLAWAKNGLMRLLAVSTLGLIVLGLSQAVGTVTTHAATPTQVITTGGPLTDIYLGNDLSTQIAHSGDSGFEVYPPSTMPGDYGTFLVVTDTAGATTLFAPDFRSHGTTATGSLGTYTAFTPVSQSGVTGAGTPAHPYSVVTVVDAGTTGLRLTQTDSYVVGDEVYRTDVHLSNSGTTDQPITLYRAMDCYLGNSDNGYGRIDASAPACTKTANNTPPDRIEQLVPLTPGNSYLEDRYSSVWAAIGTQAPFANTCQCASTVDNGAGMSWSAVIPAGGALTFSHLTTFSLTGKSTLLTTKTADAASVVTGGSDGYTITIANANSVAVTLTSVTDMLAAGFTYVAGSTSGVTSSDPSISGSDATWNGSFIVPANGSISLHFGVTVTAGPGVYYDDAAATAADGYSVAATGATAPITVLAVAAATVSATAVVPTATATPISTPVRQTPEMSSADLLAAGLVSLGLVLLYRRSRHGQP